MGKKDYELLAKALQLALSTTMDEQQQKGILVAVEFIATALQLGNPRFQVDKFMNAAVGNHQY